MKTYWYAPEYGIVSSLEQVPQAVLEVFDFREISELVATAILMTEMS